MKISPATVLGVSPLFFVSYFTRVGESSLYVFDFYFVLVLLICLPRLTASRTKLILFYVLALPLAAAPGMVNGAALGTDGDWFQMAVVCARYLQFFIFAILVVTIIAKEQSTVSRFPKPALAYASLMLPLVYGLVMVRIAPERVLFADRLASYFGNPNALGAYVCVSLMPMVVIIGLLGKRLVRRAAFVAYAACAIACLFYSGSMSGWTTSLLAALIAVSVFARGGRRLKILVSGAIVAAALLVAASTLRPVLESSEIKGLKRTAEIIETVESRGDALDIGSGRLRVSLAEDAMELYLSSPVTATFGIGLGQSPSLLGEKYGGNITTHTAYLVILLEGGLLVVILLTLMFRSVLRAAGIDRWSFGVFSGYLLAMLSSPHIYLPFLWGATAYGLGLVVATRHRLVPRPASASS